MSKHKTISSTILIFVMIFIVGGMAVDASVQDERVLPMAPEGTGGDIYLDSARFQARIRSETDLSTLAKQQVALGARTSTFAFAAMSAETKFFIMGLLYAETVADLRSRNFAEAAKRLETISQELIRLQAPTSLYNYLSKMQNLVEHQEYSDEVLMEFLALLQPFLDDYARSKGDDMLTLFRAGTWLMDIGLAAAAKDTAMLRQPTKAHYFSQALQRLSAPKGVLEAMEQITRITEKQEISDTDTAQVLTLVKKIQEFLA